MYSQALSTPHHGMSSSRAVGQSAALQSIQKHTLIRSAPCRRRYNFQQQRSLVQSSSSSQSNAAAPAEQSDVAEGVAVSTMDALLTVMDDGTSEQEEQAPEAAADTGTGVDVPAAMLEASAELSQEETDYAPEDSLRCGSS